MTDDQKPYDNDKKPLLRELQQSFETFFAALKQQTQSVKGDVPLADGQIFLLFMLMKEGSCKATDTANRIGITSGAVTGMTDKLVSMGYIRRERSEEDRRVVNFYLTDKGRDTAQIIKEQRYKKIAQLMNPLSFGEINQMLEMFNKINTILTNNKE